MTRIVPVIAALAAIVSAGSALSQTIDPKLAPAWAFMQSNMPGVPYRLLEDACKESTVTVYNGTWSDAQRSADDAFEKRFPCVKVSAFELGTGPRRERFLAETRAGQYIVDIVQDTDPGSLNEQADQNLLMKYKISNDALFEDAVKLSDFWYPLRIAITGNAWNTDHVTPDEVKSLMDWKTIINPAFKGRVGIADPSGGGATFLPLYALYKLYGEDYMKQLAALKPRIINLNLLGTALASGDVDVALGISETPLTTLYLAGAPIKWALPVPGIGPANGQAIAAHAPHPNAAKLFQEYSFTEEGYAAWQKLGGPPARNGFKDRREFADEGWYIYPRTFYQYDAAEVTNTKDSFMQKFNAWLADAK